MRSLLDVNVLIALMAPTTPRTKRRAPGSRSTAVRAGRRVRSRRTAACEFSRTRRIRGVTPSLKS